MSRPFVCLILSWFALGFAFLIQHCSADEPAIDLKPLRYHHDDLVVDLAVGLWAWPLPMDFDQDGDWDLVVACPDKPSNGIYLFENRTGQSKFPIFEPAQRICEATHNLRISHMKNSVRLTGPGVEYINFPQNGLADKVPIPISGDFHQLVGDKSKSIRAKQWSYCDFDADGLLDVMIGIGDWSDYGWDDAYDSNGKWTNGPLHGFVYVAKNRGSNETPEYDPPVRIQADGRDIDVYGWPSPCCADFDSDGDADLICGEFLDRFTFFENTGSAAEPSFRTGRRLQFDGTDIRMDLQMIVPTAIDWDHDGDPDLVVGDEDGRVALVENIGNGSGVLQFKPPVYFQQKADALNCGALATPYAVDWDGDGDQDLVCGNTAGYLIYFENLGTAPNSPTPKWKAARYFQTDGKPVRIQAGPNGSIQGPCEAKWGYTTLSVADWNRDGQLDIVCNSIWGKVVWFAGTADGKGLELEPSKPIVLDTNGKPSPKPAWNWWNPESNELVTQWRTTPCVVDWNHDGRNDLVMLDHEGYLAFFERQSDDSVKMPERIFVDSQGDPIRLNSGAAGKSGRRKICLVDWDQDGRLDVLVNSSNADWFRNVEDQIGRTVLENQGALGQRTISSHTTSPAVADWNQDHWPDLLVGAEDGQIYFMQHPKTNQ
ncbi:MAG: VCBS repeat-containing protein [Planctomycetales bacterium]|nr:VCBS repeat-containing protein [Planctomycetales bacterium]